MRHQRPRVSACGKAAVAIGFRTDAGCEPSIDTATVRTNEDSYAVIWREGAGPVSAGKLVLGPTALTLESGAPPGRLTTRRLRYEHISSVESASSPAQRVRDRPTSLLRRRDRELLAIAAVAGLGAAREILDRLAGAVPRSVRP